MNERVRNALLILAFFITAGVALVALARVAGRPSRLLDAAASGDSLTVAGFLADDVSVHVRDGWQSTPLMYATSNGHAQIAALLLDRGADVNERTRMERTALMWAAYGGHEATVELLLQRRARTDLRDQNGETAQDLARQGPRPELAARIR